MKGVGLIEKYKVKRIDGKVDGYDANIRYPSQPKIWRNPDYFILKLWPSINGNLQSKKHELAAIKAYADSCENEYPELAKDLREKYLTEKTANDRDCENQIIEKASAMLNDICVDVKNFKMSIPVHDTDSDEVIGKALMYAKELEVYFDNFLKMTRSLDEHPEDYDGPCECETCQSYMVQDC